MDASLDPRRVGGPQPRGSGTARRPQSHPSKSAPSRSADPSPPLLALATNGKPADWTQDLQHSKLWTHLDLPVYCTPTSEQPAQ